MSGSALNSFLIILIGSYPARHAKLQELVIITRPRPVNNFNTVHANDANLLGDCEADGVQISLVTSKQIDSFHMLHNHQFFTYEQSSFLLKAIVMGLFSREHFSQGIVYCGMMVIGVVLLQARTNGGFLQSNSLSSRCYLFLFFSAS